MKIVFIDRDSGVITRTHATEDIHTDTLMLLMGRADIHEDQIEEMAARDFSNEEYEDYWATEKEYVKLYTD